MSRVFDALRLGGGKVGPGVRVRSRLDDSVLWLRVALVSWVLTLWALALRQRVLRQYPAYLRFGASVSRRAPDRRRRAPRGPESRQGVARGRWTERFMLRFVWFDFELVSRLSVWKHLRCAPSPPRLCLRSPVWSVDRVCRCRPDRRNTTSVDAFGFSNCYAFRCRDKIIALSSSAKLPTMFSMNWAIGVESFVKTMFSLTNSTATPRDVRFFTMSRRSPRCCGKVHP